jgi:hypothetical protein
MGVEQMVVPGVISLMLVFIVVLGGTAFWARDRK